MAPISAAGSVRNFPLRRRRWPLAATSCATRPLLWYPEARRRLGPDCHARIVSASAPVPFDQLLRLGHQLTETGALLPLGACDPSGSIWPGRPPSIRGL